MRQELSSSMRNEINLRPDEYRSVPATHSLAVRITIALTWVAAFAFVGFMALLFWTDRVHVIRDFQHGRYFTAIGVPVAVVIVIALWRGIRGSPFSH
jgi:hypothetical protein